MSTKDCLNKDSHSYDAVIKIPVPGAKMRLGIRVQEDNLREIAFVSESVPLKSPGSVGVKNVVSQLNAYFFEPDYRFSLALLPEGTPFQKRVWKMLRRCPTGKVWSYGELAKKLNSGPRAVGNACRYNPIPIIVPCHRIVSAKGIGGYSGETAGNYLTIKQWLLHHESAI